MDVSATEAHFFMLVVSHQQATISVAITEFEASYQVAKVYEIGISAYHNKLLKASCRIIYLDKLK